MNKNQTDFSSLFNKEAVQLIHGDCLVAMADLVKKGVKVDAIITDPPYNISKENNFSTMKTAKRQGVDFGEWDKEFDVSDILLLIPKLNQNGSLVLFHGFEQYGNILSLLLPVLNLKDKIIWQKTNPMPRNRDRRYISNIEMASWWTVKNGKWTFNRQNENYDGCVLTYPSESGGGYKRYHPCQKSIKLMENIVLRHTNENDIVFDPFMCSGSTGVACIKLNRQFIGCETEQKYFDIANERIKNLT